MKSAVFLIGLASISFCYGGIYGGGTGYWDSPFIINSSEHLNSIGLNTSDFDKHFKLTADIDMSEYTGTAYNIIGGVTLAFSGTFDGNGHTISNLSYNTTQSKSYVGLFGNGNYCTIKNLTLENVNISSNGSLIGGIIGSANWAVIENCSLSGTITGGGSSQSVGGLAGSYGNGTITSSWCRITVAAGDNAARIGGMVGSGSPTINDCYTTGTVTGGISARSVGGLIGNYSDSIYGHSIENCYSLCNVEAGSIEVGGLVGYQALPVIRNCFSSGNVKGGGVVGGLVGFSRISTLATDSVTDCYSTSNVTMSSIGSYAGGLIGYSEGGQVSGCYAMGNLGGGRDGMGGLVGVQIGGKITNCTSGTDVTAIESAKNIGGFAGALWSTIVSKCASSGNVTTAGGSGTWQIGGFAGVQDAGGTSNCYSLGNVTGGASSSNVGGFIGYQGNNFSSIDKCFSAGAVSGGVSNIGGLIGYSAPGCTVTTCFWDSQASGQTTSAGGKGKTTADMQNSNTFMSAGWDFDGETANGTDDIWEMRSYPALTFEPSIGVEGDLSASVAAGSQATVTLTIFNLTNQLFTWTIDGYSDAGWITGISPLIGSSAGQQDTTDVTITLDGTGLNLGSYYCKLVITADNGDTANVPLVLTVYNSIDMEDYAAMGSYWNIGLCDFGDECKPFDWYVDGAIDHKDLMQIAVAWLGQEIEKFRPTINDGFETGDLTALAWKTDSSAPWTVVDSSRYAGSYSAKSGDIGHSQLTAIEFTADTTGWEVDTVGFAYQISSENGYDYMRFYIDGSEKFNTSGQTGWLTATYAVTPGVHTFRWVYSKDSDGSSGSDCVWIDNIKIYAK